MNTSPVFMYKRISNNFEATGIPPEFYDQYVNIQKRFRRILINSFALGLVGSLLRRRFQPQFGLITNTWWNNIVLDCLPPLMYANYKFSFGLFDLVPVLNKMDPYANKETPFLTMTKKQNAKDKEKSKFNRKYYSDTQYWH